MLPADWRERMVEMIRGAAPPEVSWFAGGPGLTPLDQIEIYQEQYRLRLGDAVKSELPGLAAMLGDDIDALVAAYLADHPSRSFTLNRVALALGDWLVGRPGIEPWHVELARLDVAVSRGFEAAAGTSLRPEALVAMPRLRLQPPVSLVRLTWNVHAWRSAHLADEEAPELEQGDFPVIIYRRGIKMRHYVPHLLAWRILHGLPVHGGDVGATIEAIVQEEPEATGDLAEHLGAWFADFARLDLVELATP